MQKLTIIPKKILNIPGNASNEAALNLCYDEKFNSFFVLYSSKLILFQIDIKSTKITDSIVINTSNQASLLDFWQIENEYLIIQSKVI